MIAAMLLAAAPHRLPVLPPKVVMAAKAAIKTKASITEYSTAVAASSAWINRTTDRMVKSFLCSGATPLQN